MKSGFLLCREPGRDRTDGIFALKGADWEPLMSADSGKFLKGLARSRLCCSPQPLRLFSEEPPKMTTSQARATSQAPLGWRRSFEEKAPTGYNSLPKAREAAKKSEKSEKEGPTCQVSPFSQFF